MELTNIIFIIIVAMSLVVLSDLAHTLYKNDINIIFIVPIAIIWIGFYIAIAKDNQEPKT